MESEAELLADYSATENVNASNPEVSIDAQGKVFITWDQVSNSTDITSHNIWFVRQK